MQHYFRHSSRGYSTAQLAAAALVLLFVGAGPSWAQEPAQSIPSGRVIEFDLGMTFMDHSGHPPIAGGEAVQQPRAAGDDRGGYFKVSMLGMVNRHLGLGVEVGGWVLPGGGASQPTASAVPAFLTARIYPFRMVPLHVRVSGGFVAWREESSNGYNETGLGYEVGIGYDLGTHGHGHITPFVSYAAARPGEIRMHTLTVGAGWSAW